MAELFNPTMSTDEICVGQDDSLCLTDDLTSIKTSIATKADSTHTHATYLTEDDAVATFALASHTHANYLSEDDAVAAFASANHTHTDYAAATHTHTDLSSAIDALDSGKAESTHTHAQADVTGLVDKLTEIDTAIAALQAGDTEATVTPMLIASMHLGKLDNNSGAEVTSSTRICSDPFAVESGKSYWQVNDKAVNMYVLIYDADELFLEYMGNYASGAEIAVTNTSAAYMRLGSLLGEYDLTNEFKIYNVDPNSTGSSEETIDAYTKTESDARYALIAHTHTDYAATDHTHSDYAASTHTHTASDITGLPSSIDAYSKTEADARYALSEHTHTGYAETDHTHTGYAATTHTHDGYMTESDAVDAFAGISHTHTPASIGAAASSHTHSDYAAASHSHSGYASSSHTHSYLPLSGGTVTGETNFSGGLVRVSGVQTLFHSGSQMILSSMNLPTRICGSSISATSTIAVDSDERLKENVMTADVDACVDFVNGLDVKTFNYIGNSNPCIGVIAQDVDALDPEIAKRLVCKDDEGYYSIKTADLVFPLIAAVQHLSKEVSDLKTAN